MPANFPTSDKALEFQFSFIQSGGIPVLLSMLSKASFLSGADIHTKRFGFFIFKLLPKNLTDCFLSIRSAYLSILRLSKVTLSVLSCLCWREPASAVDSGAVSQGPNISTDYFVRAVANQLLQHLRAETSALCSIKPDAEVVKSVIRLAWASSSGNYPLLNTPWEELGPIPLAIGTVHYQDEYITEEIQVM